MSDALKYSRGCDLKEDGMEIRCKTASCSKLSVHDWLGEFPRNPFPFDIVEIRFKNTRKGFYKNINNLQLKAGEVVAVEASPGHDIGIVSLTGELVYEQMRKCNVTLETEFKKIYRKAKPVDIEKWKKSIEQEQSIMLKAREIASSLNLEMKIGDVEYQGDSTKAIFYYIADERVDFRELIKVLAEEFHVRVEMRQIGARQEAGRIGGIGSCGRELCCATWMTNFVSVTTNAARFQELSLNPQKLAGQCSKLKCCLNYEVHTYVDARKDFPDISVPLITSKGKAYHQKSDIFKGLMWYSIGKEDTTTLVAVEVDRVKEIIDLNKKGIIVDELNLPDTRIKIEHKVDFENVVGQESITRFEDAKPLSRKKKKNRKKKIIHDKPAESIEPAIE